MLITTGGPSQQQQTTSDIEQPAAITTQQDKKFVFRYTDPRKDIGEANRTVEDWEKFEGGVSLNTDGED